MEGCSITSLQPHFGKLRQVTRSCAIALVRKLEPIWRATHHEVIGISMPTECVSPSTRRSKSYRPSTTTASDAFLPRSWSSRSKCQADLQVAARQQDARLRPEAVPAWPERPPLFFLGSPR